MRTSAEAFTSRENNVASNLGNTGMPFSLSRWLKLTRWIRGINLRVREH
jgi:hypothetical protein